MSGEDQDPKNIFAAVAPDQRSVGRIQREFKGLLASGQRLVAAGSAADDPESLLSLGFTPRAKLSLFDKDIYLTRPRQNPDLRFFVAYVTASKAGMGGRGKAPIYARIFYKDISLIWRAASHLFLEGDEMWIGKGDTRVERRGRYEYEESAESTTDLPFEMQTAIERLNRAKNVRQEIQVLERVLQRAKVDRIRAFAEFTTPRTRAAKAGRTVYGGKKVVFFGRPGDPRSLVIVPGYEPDWDDGLVETYEHPSRLYGGTVKRLRFLSKNREIQHLLFLAPRHAWMVPPQALVTELTSFAVRPVDVHVDEDAYVPGYEYHFEEPVGGGEDGNGPLLHSQIPYGYVGEASELDDSRADASAWLNKLPVLVELRRRFG